MTSHVQGRDEAASADQSIEDPQGQGKRYSRIFGALFIAGFLVYGIGFGLVSSVTTAPDFLSTLAAHSTTLLLGAFLMLLNTAVDIGKGVLFFPIAERRGKRTALVYLAAITVQVVLLDLGVLFLLLLVPLSEFVAGASASWATGLGSLLTQANTLAFELGQGTLAFGALFMTWFLFRTRMVPRTLALWGVVGYAIHLTGAIAEIFGIHVGLVLSIPGGLFEVAFGVWLVAKGFRSSRAPHARCGRAGSCRRRPRCRQLINDTSAPRAPPAISLGPPRQSFVKLERRHPMSKATVTRLFIGGGLAIIAGAILAIVAVSIASANDVFVMNGPDIVGLRGSALAWLMLPLGIAGGLAIAGGLVAGLVAWIGALLNTWQLESKTWFAVLLLLGIFNFGFFAMVAYLVAGPDGAADAAAGGRRPSPGRPLHDERRDHSG